MKACALTCYALSPLMYVKRCISKFA